MLQDITRATGMTIDIERQGQRDPLTGTATAEAMRRYVEAALDLSDSQGPDIVLLAVGLDGLDHLTARHGMKQADAVLLGIADRLRAGLRGHDLVGRLPEGFCICLPEVFSAEAMRAAKRLQRLVETTPVPTTHGPMSVCCSIGLAFGRGPGSSAADLILRAREALAVAQDTGGSRIVVAA